jgi:hypothetical protein
MRLRRVMGAITAAIVLTPVAVISSAQAATTLSVGVAYDTGGHSHHRI